MSQCMLTATIAVPDREGFALDFNAGRAVLETITDNSEFGFTEDSTDFKFELDEFIEDGEDIYDETDRLTIFRRAGLAYLEDPELLKLGHEDEESSEVNYTFIAGHKLYIAGHKLYIAGGMSFGDSPSNATTTIWNAGILPTAVLSAIGFVAGTSSDS